MRQSALMSTKPTSPRQSGHENAIAPALLLLTITLGGCATGPRLNAGELARYRQAGIGAAEIRACEAALEGHADEIADAMIDSGPGTFDDDAASAIGATLGAQLRARRLAHRELVKCLDELVRQHWRVGDGRKART